MFPSVDQYISLSTSVGAGNSFPLGATKPDGWFYSSLSTSRGDVNGLVPIPCSILWESNVYLPIYLGRGRKQSIPAYSSSNSLYSYLSTSRGAGNNTWAFAHWQFQYSYLSTSRGAGNAFTAFLARISTIVVTPIYLERGRKHVTFRRFRDFHSLKYRSLSTSRGAGNSCVYRNSTSDVVRPMYSQLLPR